MLTAVKSISLVNAQTYQVNFELVEVTPRCPLDENGHRCKALGSVVKLKAKLASCLDQLVQFEQQTYLYDDILHIEIQAKAKAHPMAASVNCEQTKISEMEFSIIEEHYKDVKLNNF